MKLKKLIALVISVMMLDTTTAFAAEIEIETDVDLNQLATNYMSDIPEDAFGGMYYNEEGQLVVNVKEGSNIDIAVPLSGEVVVESVQYSLAELEAMKESLEPYMQEYSIASLDADEVNNTIAIEVTQEDGRIYTLIESLDNIDASIVEVIVLPEDYIIENTIKYCEEIEVGEIPEEFAGMYEEYGSERAVGNTIYPGLKIFFEQASGYGQLTAGPRYSSSTFCSAGHGIYMGKTDVYRATFYAGITGFESIGTVTSYNFGESGDHSFIRVGVKATLPSANTLYGQTGKYTISPSGITGTSVEMWGGVSGITSGKITATNVSVSVTGNGSSTTVKGLSKASYTCQSGDSGAAVFSSGVATDSAGICYGIQSSGTSKDSNGVYQTSYFSPLS